MKDANRRLLSHVGAVALVGAVAGVALFAGRKSLPEAQAEMPDAVAPQPVDRLLPAFPGASEISVARGIRVNGQKMDLDFGTVVARMDDVVGHYRDALGTKARPAHVRQVGDGYYVSTIADDGRQVGVSLQPIGHGGGLTQRIAVIPSVTRGVLQPGHEARSIGLPIPDDQSTLSTYRSVDGGRVAVSAQFVTHRSLADTIGWYEHELAAVGWQSVDGDIHGNAMTGKVRILRYMAGGQRATISMRALSDKATAVFLIHEEDK